MNQKFSLYSRTEEQKTQDILVYEKKAKARDICERFEKIKKRTDLATLIAAVLFFAIALPFFFKAYDNESIIAMIAVALSFLVLTVGARLTVGAILSHSLFVFAKWSSLSSKWRYAREEMHKYEEKFADQKVFEDDMKKVEARLMTLSEELIAFAKKYNISVDG